MKVSERYGGRFGPGIAILSIILLGVLAYANTFHSPFQWDDKYFLEENPIVKDLGYFGEPSLAEQVGQYYDGFKSRYIGYLSFALNYRAGGFSVVGYHVVNLCIHVVNALLVYVFVVLTFRTPYMVRFGAWGGTGRLVAFLSSLLFVTHPVQTEAVTYVFQRLASLVTLFYLLSVVLYVKGRLVGDGAAGGREGLARAKGYIYYGASVVSAVLAMKSKENAFTLPVVVAFYEGVFFTGAWRRRVMRLVPLLLTMLIVPVTLIGIGRPAGEVINQIKDPASLGYQAISKGDYLVTEFRVMVTYIRLLFLPVGQNIDYDYPVYHAFFTPVVVVSFLFLGVVF